MTMKQTAGNSQRALLLLTGLLILAWPFLLFPALLSLGAPSTSQWGRMGRWLYLCLFFSYPWSYIWGLSRLYSARARVNERGTTLLLALPWFHVFIVGAIG